MSDRQPIRPSMWQGGPEPVALPLAFGDVLRRLRRAAGLSQEALAERATLSWRTISDLERGIKRRPQQETFRLLIGALGLSPEDRALLEAAARGRTDLPAPAVVTPIAPRARTLPAPMTPLVGRAREIATCCARLRRDDVRLLTVAGPGGVGKTRLAIAIGTALAPDFPDGVHFVALAPIRDPALLLPTIAQSLGLQADGKLSPQESLIATLNDQRCLLILDNFEQLTAEGGAIAALLGACPSLTVLVTSRAALRVYGEHEYPLAPLPLPEAGAGSGTDTLARSAAVELFRQRASAIRPGFAFSPENAAAIAAICTHLDGLPLAIELAAARTKLFSPSELLARLTGAQGGASLRLLTEGARDAPTRQRTMRGAIAWSYELLTPDEQTLFRRLGVFVRGWTLETAEAVCASDGAADVYDGITALIDQSLVRTREGPDGDVRFGMLETIREFGREQLAASGEWAAIERRHATAFLALAETAAPELVGPTQTMWLARLEAEHDNLRAALAWARKRGDVGIGLRIAAALAEFWHVRGYLTEGRQWLEAFLALAGEDPDGTDVATRAKAREGMATLATRQGDYGFVKAVSAESLRLYREIGDKRGIAVALHSLGRAAFHFAGYERATAYFTESLALRREINDRIGMANTLSNLGRLARFGGDYDRATTLLREAIALWRESGDALGLAMALGNLGHMTRDRGHRAQAQPIIEESLALYRGLKNTRGIGIGLGQLALLAYDVGDFERTHALTEESLVCYREIGDKWGIASGLCTLGDAAMAMGNRTQAAAYYREGLSEYRAMGVMLGVPECLTRIAQLMGEDDPERAARLLGAVAALRKRICMPILPVDRPKYDAAVAALRDALGAAAFAAAWEAGQAMNDEDAVAEARNAVSIR